MATARCLELKLTDGPVLIRGLGNAGLDASYPLWDDMHANEWFPAGAGESGAKYVLTVKARVSEVGEVRRIEDKLTEALRLLSMAWPFSGGSYMPLKSRRVTSLPRVSSNAGDVEQELLEEQGVKKVELSCSIDAYIMGSYIHPPLLIAIEIAKLIRSNFLVKKLFEYHCLASEGFYDPITPNDPCWYINLYKVSETLVKLCNGPKRMRTSLGIPDSDWKHFQKQINKNDLRHAETTGNVPTISKDERTTLYQMGSRWISSYLRTKSICAA